MAIAWHQILMGLALLSTGYPLGRAWRANAATSLRHTMFWGMAAWLAWLVANLLPPQTAALRPARYLALSLSACAVVAVLGARRPGMAAWNFVVGGLLAVLLLPLLQQPWAAEWQLEGAWVFLLGTILVVGIGNYLPTRLGIPALAIGIALGWELLLLASRPGRAGSEQQVMLTSQMLLVVNLWGAYLLWRSATPSPSAFDQLWLDFRDRYGVVWGWRVLEQFNNAAAHAGWAARLTWRGLRWRLGQQPPSVAEWEALLQTLQAVLKRFERGCGSAPSSEEQ